MGGTAAVPLIFSKAPLMSFPFLLRLREVNFNTVFMQIKALATQVTGGLEALIPNLRNTIAFSLENIKENHY